MIPYGHDYDNDGNPVEIDPLPVEQTVSDRWLVDLSPFLDGTYTPPAPSRGVTREDGKHILYPGKWHTMIGPTGAGKSWFACQCVFDELLADRSVLYAHFEESLAAGTVGRLLLMGLDPDLIRKRFHFVDRTMGRITGAELAALVDETEPSLVILDGINAACSQYDWDVEKTAGVGKYRSTFVEAAAASGSAVLSLGHPPKARDRQNERHGFGSSAWLDEVDGVGFRIVGSKTQPIRRGGVGYANVSTVKDRYGQVEEGGDLSDTSEGWFDIGSLRVDSDPVGKPSVRVRLMRPGATASGRDVIDSLADQIVGYLGEHDEGRFSSLRALGTSLRAAGGTFQEKNLSVALERLKQAERLEWPEVAERQPRPGWLVDVGREVDRASHDR